MPAFLHSWFCPFLSTINKSIFSMFLKQLTENLTAWAEVSLETCRRNKNQIQFPPFLIRGWIHCGKYLLCGEAMSKYMVVCHSQAKSRRSYEKSTRNITYGEKFWCNVCKLRSFKLCGLQAGQFLFMLYWKYFLIKTDQIYFYQ